ncbi:LysM peptidoglycan-binding domain-containing protein [Curtobacterium luteum]|uniref:LysM peptidoglycan-binding domain-containing protein n=1 Tax=Curtobacterium luteum TaxID=33881 RepID=UPI00380C89BA
MRGVRTSLRAAVVVLVVAGAVSGCSRWAEDPLPPAPTRASETVPDGTATEAGGPDSTPAPDDSTPEPVATAPALDHGVGAAAAGRTTGDPGSYRYVVADGDAVQGIAARFGLCTVDLYRANPGVLGHEIVVGQTLVVERRPGPGHTGAECDDPFPAAAGG